MLTKQITMNYYVVVMIFMMFSIIMELTFNEGVNVKLDENKKMFQVI